MEQPILVQLEILPEDRPHFVGALGRPLREAARRTAPHTLLLAFPNAAGSNVTCELTALAERGLIFRGHGPVTRHRGLALAACKGAIALLSTTGGTARFDAAPATHGPSCLDQDAALILLEFQDRIDDHFTRHAPRLPQPPHTA